MQRHEQDRTSTCLSKTAVGETLKERIVECSLSSTGASDPAILMSYLYWGCGAGSVGSWGDQKGSVGCMHIECQLCGHLTSTTTIQSPCSIENLDLTCASLDSECSYFLLLSRFPGSKMILSILQGKCWVKMDRWAIGC